MSKDSIYFKARLVAKGYAQMECINYNEVFSSVVKYASIRILLALVAQYDLKLAQLDVKTAFLYGNLEKEIYMSQSDGFRVVGKKKIICKLKRSIYGLKQSPRQYGTSVLIALCLTRSTQGVNLITVCILRSFKWVLYLFSFICR